jgi:hypothetical protein
LTFQGLGKALDISNGGMLVETIDPVDAGLVSLTAADSENNLIEIEGNVVYCRASPSGRYQSGISFIGTVEQVTTFLNKLIKEYSFQKKEIIFLSMHDDNCVT